MYIVFDTETTGLPKRYSAPITDTNNWPRMVQLAWKLYDEHGVNLETRNLIIKRDGFSISDEAARIHRITNERSDKEGIPLAEALDIFEESVKKAKYLIAHNITFDEKIVGCELVRLNRNIFIYNCVHVDTMKTTVDFCAIPAKRGGGFKFPQLSELHFKLFNEYFEDAHDALVDVEHLAKCFFELQKRGILGYKANENQTNALSDAIFNNITSNQTTTNNDSEYKPLVNLSVHTFHSILEGAGSAKDYINLAKKYNQNVLAITDIATLSGSFDFYNKCKASGIKPVIGIEFFVNDKIGEIENGKAQGESYKIRAYAKNDVGFKNISKLLYLANTEGYFMVGRICSKWLFEHKEGIIVTTTSTEGKVAQLLQKGKGDEAEAYLRDLVGAFGKDNVYAELQLNSNAQQRSYNNFMILMADKLKMKTILSNNIYFPEKEDYELQNIVTAIKQKVSIDIAKLKENLEMYFFSSNDYFYMNKKNGYEYPDKFIEHCFKNSLDFAEKCNYDFEIGAEKYPKYEPTKDVIDYFKTDNPEEIIYKLSFAKLKQKLKALQSSGLMEVNDEIIKKYSDRLSYELEVIKSKNTLDYFLVNWEIIRDYRSQGYDIGPARGCFSEKNKVIMEDGSKKPINEVLIGEVIFDAHGDKQKVLDVIEYDIEEEIIELELEDGRIIECTKDHKILTSNRGWVKAVDLTEDDEIEEIEVKLKKERTNCYCGNPIDKSNPDCVEFNLCKDHAMDC